MRSILNRREFLAATSTLAAPLFLLADEPSKGLVIGQPEGAAAGNAVLAAGGNAVDAIVAAALVAGVVALPSTGIGGYGGALVLARPDGKVSSIDFNGTAPAAAKPDMFAVDANGAVKDRTNSTGWLASGVPGVLAGLQLAIDKFGSKSFAELVKPAIRFAREGFPIRRGIATAIKAHAAGFSKDPGSAKLFLKDGKPLAEGETFRNPDLAAMLQKLADKGRVDDFYKGEIASVIAAGFKKNGGLVTAKDLEAFSALEVKALELGWNKFTIHTPPPTSGGLSVLQALATLKALGYDAMDFKSVAAIQSRVEALRIAWLDRLKFLGDPKAVDVPIAKLLSKEYAEKSAARVAAAVKAGRPIKGGSPSQPTDGTIHLNAVDGKGMMASLTFTHGEAFGAGVTVDGLGLTLGHGISRFDPRPGLANSIGPDKRPLHNMCPTVVIKDGKPVLALGATGGRRIPNTVFDVLMYRIAEGKTIEDAVKSPRMHTEGDLNLNLEATWPRATNDDLKKIGYTVKTGPGASLSAIEQADWKVRFAAR